MKKTREEGDLNMEYEEKLGRIKELRKKYPKLNIIEHGGHLVGLIFAHGVNDEVYEWYFNELDKILSKVKCKTSI